MLVLCRLVRVRVVWLLCVCVVHLIACLLAHSRASSSHTPTIAPPAPAAPGDTGICERHADDSPPCHGPRNQIRESVLQHRKARSTRTELSAQKRFSSRAQYPEGWTVTAVQLVFDFLAAAAFYACSVRFSLSTSSFLPFSLLFCSCFLLSPSVSTRRFGGSTGSCSVRLKPRNCLLVCLFVCFLVCLFLVLRNRLMICALEFLSIFVLAACSYFSVT